MSSGWREVPISEVLTRVRRPITPGPDELYHQVGLRSFGKGFFHKKPLPGRDLGNKKMFEMKEGDFVFNIVFAWEGAVGVAGPSEDGLCGSHRFPTYRTNPEICDGGYLRSLFRTGPGVALLADASPGSAGRNRTLNQERLLQSQIRLPPLAQQVRIVDLLGRAEAQFLAAQRYAESIHGTRRSVVQDALRNLSGDSGALGDLAELRIGRTPPRKEPRYWTEDLDRPFCTIADMTGQAVDPMREGVTEAAEIEGKAKRVPAGSLLMSFKLTIGKVGFATRDLFPNEAIVWIEPKGSAVSSHYLAAYLESFDYDALTGAAVKGKTLNLKSMRGIPVTVPTSDDQAQLDQLVRSFDRGVARARDLVSASAIVFEALLHALVFGVHEIPETYDRLLDDTSESQAEVASAV